MAKQKTQNLGFEGWLNELSQQFSNPTDADKIDPSQPLDDTAKLRRLLAIDRRYMFAMPRTQMGLVNKKVVQDLEEIRADYETLLQAGPPRYPYYTEEAVRAQIAAVLNSAAQACDSLHQYQQASQYYEAAAQIYTALGKEEEAQRCRANLARLKFEQEGNVDDEIQRLRTTLATLPMGTVAHADALIELAGLYSNNGDDCEAKELLLEAERELHKISGDPSGKDLAEALKHSLLSVAQEEPRGRPTIIAEKMHVSGLYRQLYLALARMYDTTDPQTAAQYRAKATQRDSRALNNEFSEHMVQALGDILGKL